MNIKKFLESLSFDEKQELIGILKINKTKTIDWARNHYKNGNISTRLINAIYQANITYNTLIYLQET